jgi:multidrug transporter EmrE-like cation transporter
MNHYEQHSRDYYKTENAALKVLLTGTGIVFTCILTMAFYFENYFAAKIFTVEAVLIAVAVLLLRKLL